MSDMYYFGCVNCAGHYLHDGHSRIYDNSKHPWGDHIDGGLLPKDEDQVQGKAVITHKDGWTALSFWDRSIDSRGNSNSNFLTKGYYQFDEMLSLSKGRYPDIYKRFKFEVTHTAMGEMMG